MSKPVRMAVHGLCAFTLFLVPITAIAETDNQVAAQYVAAQAEANQKQAKSRDNQAALAATMAGIGAGIAAYSCKQLHDAAKEAEAAGDLQGAKTLQAQAAAQCAQAAQNMANQGQNSDNSSAMQIPNMAKSEQNTPTTPTPEAPAEQPAAPLSGDSDGLVDPGTQVADDKSTAAPSTFEAPAESNITTGTNTQASNEATPLPTIKNDGITYDENAESASAAGGTANQNGFLAGAGAAGTSNGGKLASNSLFDTLNAYTGIAEEDHASSRRGKKSSAAENSDASGGSSESSEGGGSSFRSMLAGMMGAGAEQPATGGGGSFGSAEIAANGSKKAPNIFEYVNYRYRKLSREGEVGKAKPVRSLASVK